MEQGPEIGIASQHDMTAPPSISSIGSSHGCKLIPHKMLASGAAMAAPAKNANLVYEIAFLQWLIFTNRCKYTLTTIKPLKHEIYLDIAFPSVA
jgi:hypothetical protein